MMAGRRTTPAVLQIWTIALLHRLAQIRQLLSAT
jgi:hypothetical protein